MTNALSNLQNKTLRRSKDQRMLAGVCGGLAEYLNVDATLIRLGFAAVTIFTGGTALIAYAIGWIVMPEADGAPAAHQPQPTQEGDIAARIYDDPKPSNPAA